MSLLNSVRQDDQVKKSTVYDDSLDPGSDLETSSNDLENDLNGIRSQINRILDETGSGKWYDDVSECNGKKRGTKQLNQAICDIENWLFDNNGNLIINNSGQPISGG